jgi:hypothetical protein
MATACVNASIASAYFLLAKECVAHVVVRVGGGEWVAGVDDCFGGECFAVGCDNRVKISECFVGGTDVVEECCFKNGWFACIAGAFASVVGKDAANSASGGAEEVSAVFPWCLVGTHEAHLGFVDQRGGLHGFRFAFVAHETFRKGAEFVVNDGKEFVGRVAVAFLGSRKQQRDGGRRAESLVGLGLSR